MSKAENNMSTLEQLYVGIVGTVEVAVSQGVHYVIVRKSNDAVDFFESLLPELNKDQNFATGNHLTIHKMDKEALIEFSPEVIVQAYRHIVPTTKLDFAQIFTSAKMEETNRFVEYVKKQVKLYSKTGQKSFLEDMAFYSTNKVDVIKVTLGGKEVTFKAFRLTYGELQYAVNLLAQQGIRVDASKAQPYVSPSLTGVITRCEISF